MTRRVPSLVLLLLAALAPRVLPAQVLLPFEDAEMAKRRLARPAEIPAPAGTGALSLDSLRVGMRVVFSARGIATRRQAIVVAIPSRDTLVVDAVVDRALLRVPVERVTVMDVSTGLARTPRARLVATSIGAAAGFVVGSVLGKGDSGRLLDAGTVVGTLAGGVVGLAIGNEHPGLAWRPVALVR